MTHHHTTRVKKKKGLCERSMELVLTLLKLSSLSLAGAGIERIRQPGTHRLFSDNNNNCESSSSSSSSSALCPFVHKQNIGHETREYMIGSPSYEQVLGNGSKYSNIDKRATDFITRIQKRNQNDVKLKKHESYGDVVLPPPPPFYKFH